MDDTNTLTHVHTLGIMGPFPGLYQMFVGFTAVNWLVQAFAGGETPWRPASAHQDLSETKKTPSPSSDQS